MARYRVGGNITVTRPGGTTPRGLPYPGSTAAQASTPAALQALAEAITGQLSTLPGGIMFDTFVGNLTTGNIGGYQSGALIVPFANLGTLLGAVASYGNFIGGGPVVKGWVQNDYFNVAKFWIVPALNAVPPYENAASKTFSVCALGWGYPA